MKDVREEFWLLLTDFGVSFVTIAEVKIRLHSITPRQAIRKVTWLVDYLVLSRIFATSHLRLLLLTNHFVLSENYRFLASRLSMHSQTVSGINYFNNNILWFATISPHLNLQKYTPLPTVLPLSSLPSQTTFLILNDEF